MDNLVFEESVNSEMSQSEFVDKQFLFVNDNNNSSYSSQIVLDTTPLSNAGGYINWSEAFLAIPLVLQMEGPGIGNVGAAKALDYAVGLKSGFWQILHSMTVEFNNGNIIQQVPFLNVFCSFKNLTSWSDGDIKDWGALTGFFPDTARSWIYNSVASSNTNLMSCSGNGLSNNRVVPYITITIPTVANAPADPLVLSPFNSSTIATTSSANIRSVWNEGLARRMKYLNYSLRTNDGTAIANASSNQASLLASQDNCATTFMSYVKTDVDNLRAIVFDAVIRLKDIADFFHKCPMMKGATMRIYLNTNQVYFTCAVVPGYFTAATGVQTLAGATILTSAPVILGGGGTCPVMVASNDVGQGLYNLAPLLSAGNQTQEVIKVALSIVRTQFSQMTNVVSAPITSCRLYAPCYTMSPISESRYLSLTPTKRVLYNDIFQYSFANVPQNFNLLVSNGLPNLRGCLVIPLVGEASNGVATNFVPFNGQAAITPVITSTLLSPFASTGGTPDPIQITNFNIQVSGKNLFLQQQQYNYENFAQQVVSSNQLNGSLTTSLASGLIGFEEWQNLYRYYYGNVSRSLPSEDGVAKAIQILGTFAKPSANLVVNLMVFLEFEREITIDLRTGARIA
jgi:hypothetical protein